MWACDTNTKVWWLPCFGPHRCPWPSSSVGAVARAPQALRHKNACFRWLKGTYLGHATGWEHRRWGEYLRGLRRVAKNLTLPQPDRSRPSATVCKASHRRPWYPYLGLNSTTREHRRWEACDAWPKTIS